MQILSVQFVASYNFHSEHVYLYPYIILNVGYEKIMIIKSITSILFDNL